MLNKILCVKAPNIYEHNFFLESVSQLNVYCLSPPYIKVTGCLSMCLSVYQMILLTTELI